MRALRRLFAISLVLVSLFSCASCFDLGEGEDENAFHDYFSAVYLFSLDGRSKRSISTFNASIESGDEEMQEVVKISQYSYVIFRVASDYTLTVSDFACHAKTDGDVDVLHLDFYVSSAMPNVVASLVGGETQYPDDDETQAEYDDQIVLPEEGGEEGETGGAGEGEGEEEEDQRVSEKDVLFNPAYANTSFAVSPQWNSTHLEFGEAQTVYGGEYIVVRIRNNCVVEDLFGESQLNPVSFTFNYLMFRFERVVKN